MSKKRDSGSFISDDLYSEDQYSAWKRMSFRQRARLHIGGTLFMALGLYIIWRTFLALYSLAPMPVTEGDTWQTARYIFVFGDSYSSVGYDVHGDPPSLNNPLGNPEYPGDTWSAGPNWVDYLVTEFNDSLIFGFDYAVGGHTVQGVIGQVDDDYLPHAAQKPAWAPWTAEDSVFLTWVGINDVLRKSGTPQTQLTLLFDSQELIYDTGARKFVFLKVPPIERSPRGEKVPGLSKAVSDWNSNLTHFAQRFSDKHRDAYVEIYDAVWLFNEVLDHPDRYGFKGAWDVCPTEECIWLDELHPTWAFHKVLAQDMASFLDSFENRFWVWRREKDFKPKIVFTED